jgi:hypothetical protein
MRGRERDAPSAHVVEPHDELSVDKVSRQQLPYACQRRVTHLNGQVVNEH